MDLKWFVPIKGHFTHRPRAATIKIKGPLKIMKCRTMGNRNPSYEIDGPSSLDKVKVDHVEQRNICSCLDLHHENNITLGGK